MSSYKFLHAADIHLDSPLKGLESYPDAPVEQIRSATRRAFDNMVNLATEEQVSFVLLAGDISDGDWKDYNTGLFFAQRMGRLREAGIKVFVVSGNHDAVSAITKALKPPDNVHFFPKNKPESKYLEHLGVIIHGQSYKKRDVHEDLAAQYPQAETGFFNIGLLHTALTGRSGHEPYAPTNLNVLKSKGFDYWALGHVHQREIVSKEPWVVFPGNIQGRNVKEIGAKGCTLVHVDEGQISEVEHRDVDILRWYHHQVDLSGCNCPEDIWKKIRLSLNKIKDQSEGRPIAIRLELHGQTSLHSWLHYNVSEISEECRVIAAGLEDIWLEKIQIKTYPERNPEEIFEEGTPFINMVRSVKELTLSRDFIQQIPELVDLQNRLPHQILGKEGLNLDDPSQIEQLQEDVREFLLGRLLRRENFE